MSAIAVPIHSAAKVVDRPDLPKEILGQPVTYVEKPILTKGLLVHPKLGWEYRVDDQELDLLAAETTKYISAGNKPFLPEKHMEKYDAKSSYGYLVEVRREGDALVGLHQLIGEDAKKYAARNDTSVLIDFAKRDGRGNRYSKVITHNALCPDPVNPGMGGFIGMSMSYGAVPVMKKKKKKKLKGKSQPSDKSGPLQLSEGQTARRSAEVKLTEQQLARARDLLGGTDVNEDNVFERMAQALETGKKKLAASVSVNVPDDSMMFMLKPTIDAKRQAALQHCSKATVDAIMAPFEKEGKLLPLAFSQSGEAPLVYTMLDALAKNASSPKGTNFGSQAAFSQSLPAGNSADDEESNAADGFLRARGMLPPEQPKQKGAN